MKLAAACNVHSLLADLKTCSRERDLQRGRSIHAECGDDSNLFVKTALVKMYANCGSMVEACRVFDTIQNPDVVSWNALLLGYAENGEALVALKLFFSNMASGACLRNSVTYLALLKACTSLAVDGDQAYALRVGTEIHSGIGCHLNLYVQNALIDMYGKCGSMLHARQVFNSMPKPDVVSWTSLLLGYIENGQGHTALELFSKMKARGCAPDTVTYIAVLKACTSMAVNGKHRVRVLCLEVGRRIHSEIGCRPDLYLQNTLIDMYANCGSMVDAREVFESIQKPSVVSWNSLLLGYAENGEAVVALDLFSKMSTHGCTHSYVTYVAVLKACASLAMSGNDRYALEMGRSIHSEIGSHSDLYVQNTLIDMYTKCGSMVEARQVFESIQQPNLVSWNALLLGYAENGEGHVAMDLFSRASRACVPDSLTYVAVLKACCSMGALALGRKLHSAIQGFTPHLVTCLVDFYTKCGSMVEARAVFDLHTKARSVSTWNALLAGYSASGDTVSVFNLFDAMQDQGFRPNAVTLLCLLLCCTHAGLVEKAREYLQAMPGYGITPTVKHYTCLVDTLGRANQLHEAIALLSTMPCSPDAVLWMTLLGACRKWKKVEIARWAFECLTDMDNKDSAPYVLMAHIYGCQGMWEEQEIVLEAGRSLATA